MNPVPSIRIQTVNNADYDADGKYVLYWMSANRRLQSNFALQRAIEWSRDLQRPLLIFEALRCGYRWASDRIHQFVIQGMADHHAALQDLPATYYPYLERHPGDGKGLIRALAGNAAVVVGDDYPCFFLPRMIAAAARQVPVRFELVDANGLLPMRAADKVFSRAFDFRRFLQKILIDHLADAPDPDPFQTGNLPKPRIDLEALHEGWPVADVGPISDDPELLSAFDIDHNVPPISVRGGSQAARKRWSDFLDDQLDDYADRRNHPDDDATSGLSPYLHFGHIGVHQLFGDLMSREEWTPDQVSAEAKGSSSGWWNTSDSTESFLDELITWRELGFNMCWQRDDYDRYSSLPDWARKTLAEHAEDSREYEYCLSEFENAETHDVIWNAAQRQLRQDGRIHNYLRMLWGKKILEWTKSPEQALEFMLELNNKYAVDGRDPNSYSGIFWVLGRYDRAWGPERPIFGKIRYMSSDNTARKLSLKGYLAAYGPAESTSGG